MENGSISPAPVRPARRKKRMGLSSLMRATIQEYGVYDKDLDIFKGKLQSIFCFLDQTSLEMKGRDSERATLQKQQENIQGGYKFGPKSHLSYEEELQAQVERLSSIAKTFKGLYLKERDLSRRVLSRCHNAQTECNGLVGEVIQHFSKQMGILQQRLLEMESQLEEAEQDKTGLKRAYENMVGRAASMVEGLEMELMQANMEKSQLEEGMQDLHQENQRLKEENMEIWKQTLQVQSSLEGLDQQLCEQEKKLDNAECARQNFETLLDIAITKLHLYEEEENRLTKLWKKTLRDKLVVKAEKDEKDTQTYSVEREVVSKSSSLPYSSKSRLPSDSMSITSYETAASEMSVAVRNDSPLVEDKSLSASLKSLIQKGSPKSTPRKKKRRHPFRNFLKRSVSQDSQMQYIGGSSERLPPIHDEPCEPQLTRTSSHRNMKSDVDAISATQTSSHDDSVFGNQPMTSDPDKTDENQAAKVHDRVPWFEQQGKVKDDMDICPRPDPKKVKRTASFGGIRSPRSGLMAFARDIEKRIKKKRRSKTADFSDVLNAQTLYSFDAVSNNMD